MAAHSDPAERLRTPDVERLLGAVAGATDEAALAQRLLGEMVPLIGADQGSFFGREGNGLILRASTGFPHFVGRLRLGPGIGIVGAAMQSPEPIVIEKDLTKDSRFAEIPGLDENEFSGCLAFRLEHGSERFGVFLLETRKPLSHPENVAAVIKPIASVASLAYATFHHAYALGAKRSSLGAITEVTRTLSASPYLEEILQLLVHITAQQFNYKVVSVRLLDEERKELVLRATQATVKAYQSKGAIKLGESIAGRAIQAGAPVVVPDVLVEHDYIGHDLAVEQGLRSMICVPLKIRDRAIGVMSCYTDVVREFPEEEVQALQAIAHQAAVSIEHAKLEVRHTLMQEMHHRVKNNLQQVASLLRLQLRQSHYKTLEEAITDALARILAIAAVHELLSREDLDHVGIRSIAETLLQHHQSSLINPEKNIKFDVRGEDPRLNMTQATQVALILNELISNAVEHGFAHASNGEIHITIEDANDELAVWVSNNGDRLPTDFDPAIASHLGLQIVENLSRALGGKFKIGDIWGWTVAEVRFRRAAVE
ncbi:MAG: GAF domain-containing protein [Fimbriimonadaceae bacterium]